MEFLLSLALSMHLGTEGNFNEVHPHFRVKNNHIVSGLYLNSMNNAAGYLGVNFEKNKFYVDLGVTLAPSDIDVFKPWLRAGYKFNDHINVFTAPVLEYNINDNLNSGGLIAIEFTL